MPMNQPKQNEGGGVFSPSRVSSHLVVALILALVLVAGSRVSPSVDRNLAMFAAAAAVVFLLYLVAVFGCALRAAPSASDGAPGGILNAWPRRDQLDRSQIARRCETAPLIKIMGYNMRNFWLGPGKEFEVMLRNRLAADPGLTVRIIIADPDSRSLERREFLEDGRITNRMRGESEIVLKNLATMFYAPHKADFEFRTVEADTITCSLVFVDDRVYMTPYLLTTGGNCPTYEILKTPGGLYEEYRLEFERAWNKGKRPGTD